MGIYQPLIVATVIVFVLDFVGSYIDFNHRLINALVDAVLFFIVFGFMIYIGFVNFDMTTAQTIVP